MRVGARIIAAVGAVVVGSAGFISTSNLSEVNEDRTARETLNRTQVERLALSPHAGAVALPSEQPPYLDYLQTIRMDADASEVHFQEAGSFVVICGGTGTDSACNAETATVFRDEKVAGLRVRIAWVTSQDALDKTSRPSEQQWREIEAFWKNVDVQLGLAPWLHSFA